MLDLDLQIMKREISSPIRVPKQERSRASFERVLEAAVDLLQVEGYAGFTLQQVSQRARVSIGAIYCRVEGKDDLFHAVHDHVLERLDAEVESMLDPAKWERVEPQKLIVFLVREMAEHLRRNAPILRAFIGRELADPSVMAKGKAAHFRFLNQFRALLLRHRAEFQHPNPEHAITFCFNLAFASLAKHLDLDTVTPSNDGAQWNQLIDDLGRAVSLFLLSDDLAPVGSDVGKKPKSAKRRTQALRRSH